MHELFVFGHAFKDLIEFEGGFFLIFIVLVEEGFGFFEELGAEVALAADEASGGGL